MDFADKLNWLMKLTGTPNSKLARAVAIDASLVSRWRSGSRTPAGNREMLAALGNFFALRLEDGYQKAQLRLLLGEAYGQCGAFLPDGEILALWLQGKAPADGGLQAMLLGSGLGNAGKMAMLLRTGLLKSRSAKMWLLLNLPAAKIENALQDFFALAVACEEKSLAQAEINIILPQEAAAEVFAGSVGDVARSSSLFSLSFNWYELPQAAGVFETVVFAIEDVGGIAYSGLDFAQDGFNKVYSGAKLVQLLGVLKNLAVKSSRSGFGSMQQNMQDFISRFNSLKIGTGLKPNALYISDNGGVSRYIKADSERLWGLPTEAMLGRSTAELERSGSYYPSITRMVLESGGSVCTMQTTGTGCELFVIGMPLLDADGKIEYIVNLSSEIKNKNQGC